MCLNIAGFVGINLRKLIENEEVSINENKRALILELGDRKSVV